MRAVVRRLVEALVFVVVPLTFGATPPAIVAPARRSAESGHVPEFATGAPKSAVAARLGMPSQVFGPGLWVYREFRTDHREANAQGFDTLVVVFAAERLVAMRVVNGAQLDELLAAQRRVAVAQAEPPRKP